MLNDNTNEVKCFSLIDETGKNYNLDAYYFFNLRHDYSTIYIRGNLDVNGEHMIIDRRIDFITKYHDKKRFVITGERIGYDFGGALDGVNINSFIPIKNEIHGNVLLFDIYKQLDGSFIIQKANGNIMYCNI